VDDDTQIDLIRLGSTDVRVIVFYQRQRIHKCTPKGWNDCQKKLVSQRSWSMNRGGGGSGWSTAQKLSPGTREESIGSKKKKKDLRESSWLVFLGLSTHKLAQATDEFSGLLEALRGNVRGALGHARLLFWQTLRELTHQSVELRLEAFTQLLYKERGSVGRELTIHH